MGVKQKVSLSIDIATPITPVLHNYSQIPPPPPKPPTPAPHVDFPVTMYWPPGAGMGQNKFTSSVKHRSMTIAKEGHDCGVLIPHWPGLPPLNALLALIIPFSSRKMMFSASTVKGNGAPIGTSDVSSYPTPMLTCGDPVSLPVGFPLTNAAHTVNVGMAGVDFALGYVSIAGSMIADLLASKAGGSGPGSFSWGSATAGKLLGGGNAGELLIKAAVGIATDSIKVLIKGEGNIDVMSVGSPFGQFKVTVNVDKTGKITAGWELSGASPDGKGGKVGESATLKDGRSADGGPEATTAAAGGASGDGEDPGQVGSAPQQPHEAARSALVGGLEPL